MVYSVIQLQLACKSTVEVGVLASFGASIFHSYRNISTVVGGPNPEYK